MRDYIASIIARNINAIMIAGVFVLAATVTYVMCEDLSRPARPLPEKRLPANAIVVDTPMGQFVISGVGDELGRGTEKLAEQIGISNQLEQDENKARWADAPERIRYGR